jgi:hypothetical protein
VVGIFPHPLNHEAEHFFSKHFKTTSAFHVKSQTTFSLGDQLETLKFVKKTFKVLRVTLFMKYIFFFPFMQVFFLCSAFLIKE